MLDQQFSQLAEIGSDRVREVLGREKTTFNVDGKDLTPAQLLERLGFAKEHLSARVDELSGGQKRRLQLLLLLLSEPNVIVLDEPTNDVDSDMLAAMEDLLDSWPGTLLVVSHDRYLLERITDQQYAILDKRLRHVPGGVDEYLRLRAESPAPAATKQAVSAEQQGLSGSERRAAEKELASIERRLEKITGEVEKIHARMAAHDQGDFDGLQKLNTQLRELQDEADSLEERWLELGEQIG
jgi:ABC-type multidrug transport system ATPase subunit